MKVQGGFIRYSHKGREEKGTFAPGRDTRFPGASIDCDIKETIDGTSVRVTVRPEGPVLLQSLILEAAFRFDPDDLVFCNGYQSWTDSREFAVDERMKGLRRVMRLINMQRYGDANFIPYTGEPGAFHSHTYCYVRRGGEFTLACSLSEDAGYTLFRFDTPAHRVDVIKDCRGLVLDRSTAVIDLLIIRGGERDVFTRYFGRLKLPSPAAPPATGWTSWYNYYTGISGEIILDNLAALAEQRIPIDIFQIDDGFQTAVGDWLSIKPEFPGGMKPIAREIHDRGYRAGLWLAPFICEAKSELMRLHPGWLVKDDRGRPVVAGWNPGWSGKFYALDIYQPQAREYIEQVFSTVLRDWGFDLVKLDFLYAAAIIPRAGKSRGAIMCDAMRLARRCAKGKKILGCGVPLGPSFGLVDYCRIGSDVALKWEDRLLRFMRYRERVSTINSLTSTIGRRHLNGRVFLSDPDVFILREENQRLSRDERNTLFLLNNIFGSLVFTSDNVSRYSPAGMRRYRGMFPLRRKEIAGVTRDRGLHTIHFSIGALGYICYVNLGDDARAFTLEKGVLFRGDAIQGSPHFILGGSDYTLAPRQSQCFLRLGARAPSLAGGGHLFPGSEVAVMKAQGRKITIKLYDAAVRPGAVFIRVDKPGRYVVNGKTVESETVLPETHIIKTTVE